jgi:hypothetical protein
LPVSTIPYYVVRAHVEQGYDRRSLAVDAAVDVAVLLIFGVLFDQSLRQAPWSALLILTLIVAWAIFTIIYFTVMLTAATITFVDEEQLVARCVAFLQHQQYTARTLNDITTFATHGTNAAQVRTPLPTVLLTAIATIAIIERLSGPYGFALGGMTLLSLVSLAATTGEANADLIIQKAVTLYLHEMELEEALLTRMLSARS